MGKGNMPLMAPRKRYCPPKFYLSEWDFSSLSLQRNHIFLYWMHVHCMAHSQNFKTSKKGAQEGGGSPRGARKGQWSLWVTSGPSKWSPIYVNLKQTECKKYNIPGWYPFQIYHVCLERSHKGRNFLGRRKKIKIFKLKEAFGIWRSYS